MGLLKKIKRGVKKVGKKVSKAVKKVGKAVKKVGKKTGLRKATGKIGKFFKKGFKKASKVTSKVSRAAKKITKPVTKTTKKILKPITKNVPKPIAKLIDKTIDTTINPVSAALDPVAKYTGVAGDKGIGSALKDVAKDSLSTAIDSATIGPRAVATLFERNNDNYINTLKDTDWGGKLNPDGTISVDQYPGMTFSNNQDLIDYAMEQGDTDFANQINDWYNENSNLPYYTGGTTNGQPVSGSGSDLNTEDIGKKIASAEAFNDIATVAGITEGTRPEKAKELFKKMTGDAPESLSNVKFGNEATMANRMEDLKRKMEGDVEDTTTSASSYISNMSKGLLEGAETASGRSSSLGAAKSSVSNLANKMIGQKHLKSQVEAIEKRDEARSALVALKSEIATENIKAEDAYRKAKAKTAIGLTNVEESAKMQKLLEMRAKRNTNNTI